MNESKLERGISRWDLAAIAVNTIIGTGIFVLPATVMGLIGSYSLLAFVACAVIIALIVLCFAEVSSRFQATGGMYLYAKEAFGAIVGFEVGWLYWVVRVATFAANCNAFLIYLKLFAPSADEGFWRITLICAIVLILTVINLIGVRESAIMTNIFTVGKILPLLVFAAIGVFFIEPANFNFSQTPEYGKFSEAVLLLIYAYVGFEAAAIPAGETKEPKKNVPFALLVALGFCAVLFLIIQIVSIGNLPDLAQSKTPLADAAGKFMGGFGAIFIAIGALVSILGNLNGGFLAASRIPFAMAEQNEMPQALGKTHAKFKTPYVSIILTAVVILILTINSSFYSAVTIATVTRLLVYATTCAALPVLRYQIYVPKAIIFGLYRILAAIVPNSRLIGGLLTKKANYTKDFPKAEFFVSFGIVAAILSLVLIIWLLTNVNFTKDGKPILIAVFIGLILYFIQRFTRKGVSLNTSLSED